MQDAIDLRSLSRPVSLDAQLVQDSKVQAETEVLLRFMKITLKTFLILI